IVSGGELERILRVNKAAALRVVFSGVGKTAAEIDLALRSGILIFNVESAGELDLLAERASKLRKRARIALRVNPDVFAETHPYISTGLSEHKFGIAIAKARAGYQRAMALDGVEPAGGSFHIGSQIRSVEPFAESVKRVGKLVEELRSDGMDIRYVDAGGGLGIEYGVADFDSAGSAKKYASAVIAASQGLGAHL